MVDWQLVTRLGARYTLVYAGGTVALVSALGESFFVLLLVGLGLLLLLFVAGGGGNVRMGTVMANTDSPGISGTVTDPAENDEFATPIDADLKLLFYAVGLVVLGFAALGVVF